MGKVIYSWAHLSDIHFNHGSAHDKLDQVLVLEKMRQDVINAIHRGVSHINSIYVSGDIASTGGTDTSRPDADNAEYNKAKTWLSSLGASVGLSDADIYVIPGNHDVQLSSSSDNRNLSRMVSLLRDKKESIDDAFSHEEDKKLILSRLTSYMSFANDFSPYSKMDILNSDGIYWQAKIRRDHGFVVRLIGLNTALLTEGKDDYKKLQLGNYPLSRFIAQAPLEPNEIVIVLSHHPFEWLSDEESVSAWIKSNCHIHLCGHIHNPEFERLRSGGGSDYVKIVSGAAHAQNGEIIGHGYSICEIVLLEQSLKLRIWPRKWSDKNKDFRRDVDNIPDDSDFVEHDIATNISRQLLVSDFYTIKCETPCNLPVHLEVGVNSTAIPITINRSHIPKCESPPTSPAWVGREAELDLFNDMSVKVFAVTGIGGQGKSALVGRHILNLIQSESDILWDWRNCKEEGDTLQTHLLNIIERVTDGKHNGTSFLDENITTIVEYLFKILANYTGFFVFDNIDHYIDANENKPIHGMKILIDYALTKPHNSQFIFTCRPSMKYDNPMFFEISLSGLSVTDTQKLFELRGVTLDQQIKRQIAEAQILTQGHPLWINLLATQVAKNRSTLESLINDIKQGKSAELPTTIIRSIWKTLNDKQRTVLRYMAETVRPETEDQLSKYLSKELNYNQFSKALRSLKTLALVIVKTAPHTIDTLELHPLLKTFIKCEFSKYERIRYIDSIASYFDLIISKFISSIMHGASFGMLEHWIYRTELAINAAKYDDALKALKDVSAPLLGAGHAVEFIRITKRLFSELDFTDAVLNEYPNFDNVLSDFIDVLSQLGQYDEVETYLTRYDTTIVGKSARYINMCDMRCYLYWNKREYPLAIEWGKKGVEFKQSTNIDTRFDSSHNLALSQRDFNDLEPALIYFLKGHDLSKVLDKEFIDDLDGTFYGNIGRCLFLKGDIDNALLCYKKSLHLLEIDDSKHKTTIMNLGWAHFWIGEALISNKNYLLAWAFFNKAFIEWEEISPPKAQLAYEHSYTICINHPELINTDKHDDRFISTTCSNWLKS
jgi:tetratricopeptide (TPR) repeat protein